MGLSPSLTSIPATPSRIIGQCGEGGEGDRGTGGDLIIPPPTASSAGYLYPKLAIVNALSLPVVLPSGERSSAGFDGGVSPPPYALAPMPAPLNWPLSTTGGPSDDVGTRRYPPDRHSHPRPPRPATRPTPQGGGFSSYETTGGSSSVVCGEFTLMQL